VIGVIGGYQEGGSTSSASSADVLGANVAGLYQAAAPGLNRAAGEWPPRIKRLRPQ